MMKKTLLTLVVLTLVNVGLCIYLISQPAYASQKNPPRMVDGSGPRSAQCSAECANGNTASCSASCSSCGSCGCIANALGCVANCDDGTSNVSFCGIIRW